MKKFIPRHISRDLAEQGYNNQGRGELIGYEAVPSRHEVTCRYRITTGGNWAKSPHETCTCRLGLWRETTLAKRVVDEMRKTAKRPKKTTKPKATKKPRKRR